MTNESSFAARVQEQGKAVLRRRPVRYGLLSLASFFLIFGLLGYFWLPGFAKAKLETLLSQEFGRTVRVAGVEVSPYALRVTVKGFSVAQRPGPAANAANAANAADAADAAANATDLLFGFDSLTLDLSSLSLARAIPVVSEVRLTGPRLHLSREADGRLNVADLLDKWLSGPSSPTPAFSIANITIEGGELTFDDRLANTRQSVTELSLGIPFIANTSGTVDSDVLPRFSAKVNGAPLSLGGKARPFSTGQEAALDLEIKDFDLLRITQYLPPDLPLRLESARLDAHLEIGFARPQGKDASVRLSGQTSLRDVTLTRNLPGSLPGGKGSAARLRLGNATLHLAEADLAGNASAGLSLTDFALSRGGDKEPLLGFSGLDVKGLRLSTKERQASVEAVQLQKPFGALRRQTDGEMDLAVLLAALGEAPARKPEQAKAALPPADKQIAKPTAKVAAKAAPKAEAAWKWSVKQVAVSDGSLRYADDSLPAVRPLQASALALRLDGLSSTPGAPASLDFSTRINEHGSAQVKGVLRLAPLRADLDLDLAQVDLVAVQGWVTGGLNAVLTRGEVSVKGKLLLDPADTSFKGDVALVDFSVLDKVNAADLLRWRSLKLAGLSAGTAPQRFGVDEVSIANFYARVLLTPEGRLNLQDVVKKEDAPAAANKEGGKDAGKAKEPTAPAPTKAEPAKIATAATETTQPTPTKPAATAAAATPGPAIRVGRILLSGGNINFTDRFIKPNYTANLTDLSGRIGAVAAGTLTDVAIKGKVDRTAPLEINGKMDPLGTPLNLNIQAKATGIEMSGFSPYSGRYVGYAIEKGKLSVDLRYLVDKGQLKAENNVFLDQLTIGKKVESPDAMSIPLNLVLALLKNSRGEIDINLPIEGSLSDPQFSLGGIIVKVIMNLLVKAATSPFSLLASLFGGGEELSYVAFEPGRYVLTAEADKHLQTLSKALRERAGLKLELAGYADPEAEREGLKRATLEMRVKAQKATELARQGKASGSVAEIVLNPEEYARYLERVYKAASIKKPRNLIGLAKTLPKEEMEALLLANLEPSADDMARLAKERGIAVQAWLVDKGGIEQSRVFLLAPKVGGDGPKGAPAGGRVDFTLR